MKHFHIIIALAFAVPSLLLAQTGDKTSKPSSETEQAIAKIEQDITNALLKQDAATVDRMLADDCFYTGPDGKTQTKAEFLADIKSGDLKLESSTIKDLKVRAADADFAVVTYGTTDKGSYKGRDIGGEYRWTDVFVKRDGRWQVVAGQGTGIATGTP